MARRMRVVVVMAMVLAGSVASATTYHVSYGGAGLKDGSDWANAFDSIQSAVTAMSLASETGAAVDHTVKVGLTTGAQSYAPAGYSGNMQNPTTVRFEGGYDTTNDTQTGVSVIKGSGLGGADIGLNLYKSSGDHGEHVKMHVESFDIVDVSVGTRIKAKTGYDSVCPTITLNDCDVAAGTHGVQIDWAKNSGSHGPSTVTLTDSAVEAGKAAAGHGVSTNGPAPAITVQDQSSVTSAAGDGLHVINQSAYNVRSPNNFFVKVLDSEVSNCSGAGVHYEDPDNGSYYSAVTDIVLDKATIANNGDDGLYAKTWCEGDWTGKDNTGEIHFSAVNSLIAANGDNGVYLEGHSDNRTDCSQVELDILNCTIADNALDGVHTQTSHNTGGPHVIRNTILSGNGGDGVDVADGNGAGMTVSEEYNDFFGNVGTDLLVNASGVVLDPTDLTASPVFLGSGANMYRLGPGSLLLDAANPAYAPADDLYGALRPIGLGPDIGAVEGTVVPEPAGLSLLGLALIGLRRKRG